MEKELARIYEEEVNYQAADGIKLRLLMKLRSGKLELVSSKENVLSAVLDWTAVSYTGFTDRFSAEVKVSDFNVNGNVVKKYREMGKSDTSKGGNI